MYLGSVWSATRLVKFTFIHRIKSQEREMRTSLMIFSQASAYFLLMKLQRT